MSRGEVWWVEDPRAGARPHVVLTRDAALPVLSVVLAAPATRTIRGIPTEVRAGVHDGMPDECVFSLDNTTLVPREFFRDRICVLGSERMDRVCRALAVATGCEQRDR